MLIAQHTPPSGQPRLPMSPELFEELARIADREEDVKLEYINGKVWAEPVPDSDHAAIISWLFAQFVPYRAEIEMLTGQGIKVDGYHNGRAIPDGIIAPKRHFHGQGEYPDPDGVIAAIEITSWDTDTHTRDRVEKPRSYAQSGIGVYILIDRDTDAVIVHSRPEGGLYREISEFPYGEPVTLPGLGITLDTEELKDFAR
ncbi:Uma2 family endonuclease [Nocardiopsis mwathae]|uniref:Uma2 family endonuclease n=1 Tax=Nocardiopsis mwathae TaxID=1472723 RepID=A0A7X0D613_9ACTN|nr:Uma2 family endonuclease [Nocardiopsis mwathae]MBB6171649.1 Uma2 family endonuclease [Nocardiopsis mwathae]